MNPNQAIVRTDDEEMVPVVLVMTRAQWIAVLESQADMFLQCGATPEHAEVFASCYEQVYGTLQLMGDDIA